MNPESLVDLLPWLFGGGTIFLIVFIFICTTLPVFLIFGGLGYYIYRRYKQSTDVRQASQSWLQTGGVVLKSRVEVSGGDTTTVGAGVIYQYVLNGRTYQNDQIRAGDKFMRVSSSRQAYETVDRYPEGAQVMVYYNPQNPAEAALER